MGSLSDKHGKGKILYISLIILLMGSCITLNTTMWIKILGIAVFTFGFFASHSIASGWVGKVSTHDKAQASSLYLFFYYSGSSINGTTSGLIYSNFGWNGLVTLITSFSLLAIVVAVCLVSITTKKFKYSTRMGLSRNSKCK